MQSIVVELRTCNVLLLLNYGVLLSTVHESTASICWCRAVGAVVADFDQNREYIDNSYPKMHQNLVRLNWLNSASSSCVVLVGLLVVLAVIVVPPTLCCVRVLGCYVAILSKCSTNMCAALGVHRLFGIVPYLFQ